MCPYLDLYFPKSRSGRKPVCNIETVCALAPKYSCNITVAACVPVAACVLVARHMNILRNEQFEVVDWQFSGYESYQKLLELDEGSVAGQGHLICPKAD